MARTSVRRGQIKAGSRQSAAKNRTEGRRPIRMDWPLGGAGGLKPLTRDLPGANQLIVKLFPRKYSVFPNKKIGL